MNVFMNKEGNKFNILDSAGVALILPQLGSQQNEFLNMFITVWPKAGNGFSTCILSSVYPSLVSPLLSSLYSFLPLCSPPTSLFPALALKRSSNRRNQISSRLVSFVSKPLLTAELLIAPPRPTMLFKYPSWDILFPTLSFLLRGHGCGGNTQGNASHTWPRKCLLVFYLYISVLRNLYSFSLLTFLFITDFR